MYLYSGKKDISTRPALLPVPLPALPLLCLLAALILLTGGCAGKSVAADDGVAAMEIGATPTPLPTPVSTPIATPEPTPEPVPTPEPFADSGFILPDPSVRPVAVMIDNEGDRPLPQAGIRQAQIVYEVLTEFKITRYMAIFWGSMPEMMGPVRSSRHYFLDYAMEYDAVYTHYGWSPQAQRDIPKLHIQNINGLVNGDAFWDTDKNRNNWQDSFTSGERVTAQIAKWKYRTEPKQVFPFQYAETFMVPAMGEQAVKIDLTYGKSFTAAYSYNPQTNLYDRTRNGEAQMERNTGLQVAPCSILVLVVPSARISGDDKDRINVGTVGSGMGWYVTGGKSRVITWEKTARDAQTVYQFEDGSPLLLNPGQMWIEVVPTAGTVVFG